MISIFFFLPVHSRTEHVCLLLVQEVSDPARRTRPLEENAVKGHVLVPLESELGLSVSLQPLLTAQQLASAVAGVMPGGTPALNQPILIPFNMAGQLGGQQGLVLTLPTANLTNIQGLVAAAAAGGIMTLPLQNLQGNPLSPCAV